MAVMLDKTAYCVIIVGTGLTECILAGACARIGRSVLHIDRNDFYGGAWGSIGLQDIKSLMTTHSHEEEDGNITTATVKLRKEEEEIIMPQRSRLYSNISTTTYISHSQTSPSSYCTVHETEAYLLSMHRHIVFDLAPKLVLCRGSLVQLLSQSNVGRYLEFRPLDATLTYIDGSLQKVPCSKADVFSSKFVSVIEKRILMRFLTTCHDPVLHAADFAEFESRPFTDYLISPQVSSDQRDAPITTREGIDLIHKQLSSLGRYGSTAYIYSIYGNGEVPQAFCRLAAVFGATYVLRRSMRSIVVGPQLSADDITFEDERVSTLDEHQHVEAEPQHKRDDEETNQRYCTGIVDTSGQLLRCRWLITSSDYLPESLIDSDSSEAKKQVCRGLMVTDRSLVSGEDITLFSIAPGMLGNERPVMVMQVGKKGSVAPDNTFIVHLTCPGLANDTDVLASIKAVAEKLFVFPTDISIIESTQPPPRFIASAPEKECHDSGASTKKPCVLWASFFTQCFTDTSQTPSLPHNLLVCPDPSSSTNFDDACSAACRLFSRMFPNEKFLPAAPEPEDIVWDNVETVEGSSKTELHDL